MRINPGRAMPGRFSVVFILTGVVLCFWLAGKTSSSLLNMRREYNLDTTEPVKDAPPLVVFSTVALGGLRGLVADILWIRAACLQEQGRYVEIAQLADWITKLEPRFTAVWGFHGWNMAYNISYMFPDREDRWRWVQNGISLIRDEGLLYNPGDPDLYRELGWLYQHKIGWVYDAAHKYYKNQLARQVQDAFSGEDPSRGAPRSDAAKTVFSKQFRMDTEIMREIDSRYGPLDWRLPAAHAIYWAYLGRSAARGIRETFNCDRMLFQSMTDMFRGGRLDFNPDSGLYVVAPRMDLLDGVIRAYEEALVNYDNNSFVWAYANFLGEAVYLLELHGQDERARDLFSRLKKRFPPRKDMSFEEFVKMAEESKMKTLNQRDVMPLIGGLLYRAGIETTRGNPAVAEAMIDRAKNIYELYMAKIKKSGLTHTLELPPFDEMKKLAFALAREDSGPETTEGGVGEI